MVPFSLSKIKVLVNANKKLLNQLSPWVLKFAHASLMNVLHIGSGFHTTCAGLFCFV